MALTVASTALFATLPPYVSEAAPGNLTPADPLVSTSTSGSTDTCTLGFLFTGPDTYARGVTAAHCGQVSQKLTTTSGQVVGTISRHGDDDIALIDISTDLLVLDKLPGIGEIQGTITPDQMNRTQPLLCKRGIASGLICGRLTTPAHDDFFVMSGGSDHGDSGSPVWAVAKDGALLAAGIVSGITNDAARDAYVIPITPSMTQWGLTISR